MSILRVAYFCTEDAQTFAHEGGEAGPAFGGNEVAIRGGTGWGDVDVDATGEADFGFAIFQRCDLTAFEVAWDVDEDLDAVADGENGFVGGDEFLEDFDDAFVDPDIFRAATASNVDGVVVVGVDVGEGFVDLEQVTGFFGVGQVTFKVVE